MKREKYITIILERLGSNQVISCQDCGEVSKIGHAVINHHDETVKVVCNDCFVKNYKDFLYPENIDNKVQ